MCSRSRIIELRIIKCVFKEKKLPAIFLMHVFILSLTSVFLCIVEERAMAVGFILKSRKDFSDIFFYNFLVIVSSRLINIYLIFAV